MPEPVVAEATAVVERVRAQIEPEVLQDLAPPDQGRPRGPNTGRAGWSKPPRHSRSNPSGCRPRTPRGIHAGDIERHRTRALARPHCTLGSVSSPARRQGGPAIAAAATRRLPPAAGAWRVRRSGRRPLRRRKDSLRLRRPRTSSKVVVIATSPLWSRPLHEDDSVGAVRTPFQSLAGTAPCEPCLRDEGFGDPERLFRSIPRNFRERGQDRWSHPRARISGRLRSAVRLSPRRGASSRFVNRFFSAS